jgi:hypothetical protein
VLLFLITIGTVLIGAHLLDLKAPHFQGRYLISLVPLVDLLAGLGIDMLLESGTLRRPLAVLAMLTIGIVWLPTTLQTYTAQRYQHPGFREVMQYFVTHRSGGDLLTGDPPWVGPTYAYYLNGADTFVELPFLNGGPGVDEHIRAQIDDWRAAGVQHVWSASWEGAPNRLDVVLGALARPTGLRFAYLGAAIQEYDLAVTEAGSTAGGQPDARPYAAVITDDHPVAYWRLGEEHGPTAHALVGGPDGTYTGEYELGTEGATGPGDSAVQLDGNGAYVSVMGSRLPTAPSGVTVEAWWKSCRPLSGEGLGNRWMGKVQQVGLLGIGWESWSDGWTVQVTLNGTQLAVDTPMVVDPGVWVYVAGTFDGAALRLYVNGQPSAFRLVDATPLQAPSSEFMIGGLDNPARDQTWDGAIDEVALYDRALSAESLQRHFRAAQPPPPTPCTVP